MCGPNFRNCTVSVPLSTVWVPLAASPGLYTLIFWKSLSTITIVCWRWPAVEIISSSPTLAFTFAMWTIRSSSQAFSASVMFGSIRTPSSFTFSIIWAITDALSFLWNTTTESAPKLGHYVPILGHPAQYWHFAMPNLGTPNTPRR